MLNIIFLAEMNEENLALGKSLFNDTNLTCGFWRKNESSYSDFNQDFFNIFEVNNSDFYQQSYFITNVPESEYFCQEMIDFVHQYSFKPDLIIIRGKTTNVWPVSVLKSKCNIDTPCYLILDSVPVMDDFDKSILKSFTKVFLMEPYKEDNFVDIFHKYKSSLFNHIDVPTQGILITCRDDQYKSIVSNPKFNPEIHNLINIDVCPQEELCLYVNAVKTVLDTSEDKEFRIILSKMKKKYIPIKDFDVFSFNYIQEKEEVRKENFYEYFCNFLKKEILKTFEKYKISSSYQGTDISVET